MYCSICSKIIKDVSLSYNTLTTLTKYTKESIMIFIKKKTDVILMTNHVCDWCLDLANKLDYTFTRCKEIINMLKEYLQRKKVPEQENIKWESIEKEPNDKEVLLQTDRSLYERQNLKPEYVKEIDDIDRKLVLNVGDNKSVSAQNLDTDNIANKVCYEEDISGSKENKAKLSKIHECTICLKSWKKAKDLKVHMLTHKDKGSFLCDLCGKVYKHKKALKIHVDMHNDINKFTCNICKKAFTQKKGLERHMPKHTGNAMYQCDLCGKSFLYHTSFSSHMLTHTGQRDHKCSECPESFSSKSHLNRHMRVHTGERRYGCKNCDQRFAERYNLISHEKLHDAKNKNLYKYNCTICEMEFKTKVKLDEHRRRSHEKLPE